MDYVVSLACLLLSLSSLLPSRKEPKSAILGQPCGATRPVVDAPWAGLDTGVGRGGDSSSSCPGPQRIRNVPSLPVPSSAPTVTRYGSIPGNRFSYEVPPLSISYRMLISS